MTERSLLIVEDDIALAETLGRSMTRRGFLCRLASNTEEAIEIARETVPDCALVDLKLPGSSGLACVRDLALLTPPPRIVVLTGYASISTTVEAVKLGASYYLAKPSTAREIAAAFDRIEGDVAVELTPRQANLRTVEWERIQETLREADFNISETARRLGMHRRTLARKLGKQQVK